MALVVDASVVIKAVLDEPQRDAAERAMTADGLCAPEFLLCETGNVLRRLVVAGRIEAASAAAFLDRLRVDVPTLVPDARLVGTALTLAIELDHRIYDCLYLALALALDCRLVTADDAFVAKAGRRFGARVASLRRF